MSTQFQKERCISRFIEVLKQFMVFAKETAETMYNDNHSFGTVWNGMIRIQTGSVKRGNLLLDGMPGNPGGSLLLQLAHACSSKKILALSG